MDDAGYIAYNAVLKMDNMAPPWDELSEREMKFFEAVGKEVVEHYAYIMEAETNLLAAENTEALQKVLEEIQTVRRLLEKADA